jgi:predicted nicotinamide N-methyase
MTDKAVGWLHRCLRQGAEVLLADPGRAYLPRAGLVALARYDVPCNFDVESRESRDTVVYRLESAPA